MGSIGVPKLVIPVPLRARIFFHPVKKQRSLRTRRKCWPKKISEEVKFHVLPTNLRGFSGSLQLFRASKILLVQNIFLSCRKSQWNLPLSSALRKSLSSALRKSVCIEVLKKWKFMLDLQQVYGISQGSGNYFARPRISFHSVKKPGVIMQK